jgi:hypothetical protein
MIEYLKIIDQELFLLLNGFHNEFFDGIMYWITKQETWYPFYLIAIIWMFWKYGKKAVIPVHWIGHYHIRPGNFGTDEAAVRTVEALP